MEVGQTQSKISAADFFDINLSLIPTVSDSNLIYITDAVSQHIWLDIMIHYILIKIQLIGTTMTYLIILYQQANAEASSK